jgi:hypothetical protein
MHSVAALALGITTLSYGVRSYQARGTCSYTPVATVRYPFNYSLEVRVHNRFARRVWVIDIHTWKIADAGACYLYKAHYALVSFTISAFSVSHQDAYFGTVDLFRDLCIKNIRWCSPLVITQQGSR